MLALVSAISLGGGLLFAACSELPNEPPPAVTCPLVLIDAIILTVRDSITDLPAGFGASVTARQALPRGGFGTDSGQVNDSQGLTFRLGATPGTYDITVRKPGYIDWARTVVVPSQALSVCLPQTVNVTANLQPVTLSLW
jgi:hypothetical protein